MFTNTQEEARYVNGRNDVFGDLFLPDTRPTAPAGPACPVRDVIVEIS
jgi:hypothetical protein